MTFQDKMKMLKEMGIEMRRCIPNGRYKDGWYEEYEDEDYEMHAQPFFDIAVGWVDKAKEEAK